MADHAGQKAGSRLDTLDGLRGIAALLVVVFHFTARWTHEKHGASLYPYGDVFYEAAPWLVYAGFFGVSLFFLISGFVIIMTLQRCSGLAEFAVRRVSRLWPTMLVCATLTTLLVNGSGIYDRLPFVSHWRVNPVEYVSSVLFIDPAFTGQLLGIEGLRWVDGVYWTLWVEVRFYALIAIVYCIAGREAFGWAWLAIQTLSSALMVFAFISHGEGNAALNLVFQPYFLFWFTLGICAWYVWQGRLPVPVMLSAIMALAGLAASVLLEARANPDLGPAGSLVLFASIIAVFILVLFRGRSFGFLTSKPAVAIGLASYPLYMFHERVGIIATTTLTDLGLPPLAAMVMALIALIGFALLLHRFIENPAKSIMTRYGMPLAQSVQKISPAMRFRRPAARPS